MGDNKINTGPGVSHIRRSPTFLFDLILLSPIARELDQCERQEHALLLACDPLRLLKGRKNFIFSYKKKRVILTHAQLYKWKYRREGEPESVS